MDLSKANLAPYLPPELELDPYHPDNQQFTKSKRSLEHLLVTQQAKCRPRHVRIAKDKHSGFPNIEIAKRNNVHTSTVQHVLKRKEVADLQYLLQRYDAHMSGPTLAHRKHEVWKIAHDNREDDPGTSLRAHDMLNKVEGVYVQKVDQTVKIEINANVFPKGTLDQ
jgi:hypothetical protein